MRIKNIKLYQFRNYQDIEVNFEKGINYFYGDNGSGKTSLAEAIGFLSMIKSIRTNNEKEVIKFNEEFSKIETLSLVKEKEKKTKIVISKNGKYIEEDDVEINKISSICGNIKIISFLPKDSEMFKSSPSIRRKFIDSTISMIDRDYLKQLGEYNKYLNEIRTLVKNENYDDLVLDIYLDKIESLAEVILKKRKEFISLINEEILKINDYLEEKKSRLMIKYEENVNKSKKSYKEIVKQFIKSDSNSLIRGIHLDDISLYYNDKNVGIYGSQGQNRISVISLKLTVYKIIKDKFNEDTIMIFDDVFSELDDNHQMKLLKLLKKVDQVFITGTQKIEEKDIFTYEIKNNSIRRVFWWKTKKLKKKADL